MTSGKELPTTNGEKWWKDGEKPSERLVIEALAISSLFDTRRTVPFSLPESSWDVGKINISTEHLSFEEFKGEDINGGWWVNFSMDDGGNLCSKSDIWIMLLLTSENYPFEMPLVGIYRCDKKEWMTDPYHYNRRRPCVELRCNKWKTGETYKVPITCHWEPRFHNPGFTTCMMHSQQAILWLRSRLYSLKHNIPMKDYEGTDFNS